MYYANPNSRNKIFHAENCGHLKNKSDCITFNTEEDARMNGYRQCNVCADITTKYINGNRKIMKELCEKYNMSVKLYDGRLYVFKGESSWLMLVNINGNLILYQKNERSKHNVLDAHLSSYHRQNNSKKSVEGYLRYILHHESIDFQEKLALQNVEKYAPHGQKNKNGYKKKKKNIKRRFNIGRTIKLLNELNK